MCALGGLLRNDHLRGARQAEGLLRDEGQIHRIAIRYFHLHPVAVYGAYCEIISCDVPLKARVFVVKVRVFTIRDGMENGNG